MSSLELQLDAVPETLRCQYSSKRCENPRTNKKSGGLHKFCAMHREKANRNQMRLDHRRRVLKKQQQQMLREQQLQQQQQQQLQRQRAFSAPAAMAAGSHFSHIRPMRSFGLDDSTDVSAMTFAAPALPTANLFSAIELQMLEALLFSDEEQSDTSKSPQSDTCGAARLAQQPPMLLRSPSFVNV